MVASLTEKVNKVMALACYGLIFVSATGIDQNGDDIEVYMMYNPGRNIWTSANVIKTFPDFHCQWFGLYQNIWYCCRNTYASEDAVDRVICDHESNTPTITIGPHVDDLTIFGLDIKRLEDPPQYLTFDKCTLGMKTCDDHVK